MIKEVSIICILYLTVFIPVLILLYICIKNIISSIKNHKLNSLEKENELLKSQKESLEESFEKIKALSSSICDHNGICKYSGCDKSDYCKLCNNFSLFELQET